jgi:hypothetical protein
MNYIALDSIFQEIALCLHSLSNGFTAFSLISYLCIIPKNKFVFSATFLGKLLRLLGAQNPEFLCCDAKEEILCKSRWLGIGLLLFSQFL